MSCMGVAFFFISSCWEVQPIPEELNDKNDINFAICRWYDRCLSEGLLNFPGGTLAGCIEATKCGISFFSNINPLTSCAETIKQTSCDFKYLERTLYSYPCQPDRMSLGEDCSKNPCNHGLACLSSSSNVSTQYICQNPLNLGDNCIDDWTDDTIPVHVDQCDHDIAFCDMNTSQCAEKKSNFSPCEFQIECMSNRCSEKGECVPISDVGEDCSSAMECEWQIGRACIDGKCRIRKDVNEPCDVSTSDYYTCRDGLVCVESICQKVVCQNGKEGEPCMRFMNMGVGSILAGETEDTCSEKFYCNTETNTCKKRAASGQSCRTALCLENLYCNTNDICDPRKEINEPCDLSSECLSSHCDDGVCTPN